VSGLLHRRVYAGNATVLLCHQVDAAYWQEWTLFGLPGGVQLFVLLNAPIVLLVLHGAVALGLGRRSGDVLSAVLAAAGLFAVVFHGVHLLLGDDAFRLPVSLGLLAATAVLSPWQAALAGRALRSRARAPVAPA